MYARGILFGKMKYELGDHSVVRCPQNDLVADIEFKTKGYFGGTYNAIGGAIRNEKTQEVLFELSGMWTGEMYIRNVVTGHRELLFDATHAKATPPQVRPLEEQDDRESEKLWQKVVVALNQRNHEVATDEKARIEDMQRAEAAQRLESGEEWRPRLFRPARGGPGEPEEGHADLDWILDADIDGATIEEQTQQILSIVPIVSGSGPSERPERPERQPSKRREAPRSKQAQPARGGAEDDNLIDFGQDDAPAQAPSQVAQPQKQEQQQQQQQQQPPGLQQPLQPSRNGPPAGLQQPLQPTGATLVREDTESRELDEFVDAEDGLMS
ncbi:MAG: hypothetical protein M1832_001060 [Thelocarpon impressellum]|nr:MAG: hypothetical protein M1832_001060 [Thelocarpon impressellum]